MHGAKDLCLLQWIRCLDKSNPLTIPSSRCCFGCFSKQSTSIVDEPSKGLKAAGRMVRKDSSTSSKFWSTSAGEMDNSAVQSQKGTLNQPLDHCSDNGSTGKPSEFVNHGLLLWNQTRKQWLGSKRMENKRQLREPAIRWNATYESLLGTNKPFPRPVPLAEMVDFLVDVWEQEGLYAE